MRLLHTSDWHLGINFKGRDSQKDQEYFINQISSIIQEKSVDAIMLAGDVFDRSMASAETIKFYDSIITQLVVTHDTHVLCIAGNHDSAERLSQYHELLKKTGFHVVGELSSEFSIAEYEDVDVYMLPWFSTDKAKAVFPEHAEEIETMEDAYRVVLSEMRKTFKEGKKHFLISHAYITNAETSTSDRTAEIGTATAVNEGVFEGFDYVALGHIHKPQAITDNIRYCGTPMPYSFGKEEKQEKGVIIIDTKDMSKELVPLKLLHKRTTITDTYDNILKADYPEDIKSGYVRLEVTDQYVGPDSFALFSEKYPLLLEMKGLDYSGEGAEITLSMEEFEEKSKDPEEIFKSFCKENTLEIPEGGLDLFREIMREYIEEEG